MAPSPLSAQGGDVNIFVQEFMQTASPKMIAAPNFGRQVTTGPSTIFSINNDDNNIMGAYDDGVDVMDQKDKVDDFDNDNDEAEDNKIP